MELGVSHGDRAVLEIKKSPEALGILTATSASQNAYLLEQPTVADAFDARPSFDRWLEDIQAKPEQVGHSPDEEDSEIYIGSFPGSNCEVNFEGVLHFDGYSIGNIRSPEGTLVLTKRGRIEADIDVGVAIISGSVTGNITAIERVVLDSDARVTGEIRTPLLSVKLGALFHGDCLFVATTAPAPGEKTVARARAAGA